ncbi:MAG: redoxin domain-containing protein [Pseudolabrys sp.]|nr:redoxin domain-containing protein [Pseudolabrys sp.]
MASEKLRAGSAIPKFSLPRVGGGEIIVGGRPGWTVVLVYRGKHCPLCRTYLKTLDGLRSI